MAGCAGRIRLNMTYGALYALIFRVPESCICRVVCEYVSE